ncbi:Gfo/Idh/MocA family protein [Glycomyces arizonensis]|uniref:Gfo/Idh/MocA family protein n=1 Tax=Glycomyces arizonensis TaxID=256035 RepID=UPI000405A4D2|nr:Gfo/Idh/MocA family oxidoreductase [Glycomyces arizonensis]
MTFRFAIIGAGVISSSHAEALQSFPGQAELAAVVDLNPDRARSMAERYGAKAFGDIETAVAATGANVAAVCTPTGLHGDAAVRAMEAGAHVMIEKPADITADRIDRVIAARQRTGKLVAVVSQHRFDPATETVIDAIRAGELGRLTSGTANIDWWRGQTYYDSGAWRGTWEFDGGGALMNQGVHTVDLLVAAMGRPVEVVGFTATLAHERLETEDVAVGAVRFDSGAVGTIHASTAVYPGLTARLQIHGDKGSAVIENDRLVFFHRTPAGADRPEVFMGVQGQSPNQADEHRSGAAQPAALVHQYRDFLAALGGEGTVRVGLEDNRQAVALITGLYEAARTGRPVRLDA